MKKILFILGLFLVFTNVEAFEEGVWTDEVINDSNIVMVSSETRYRWYKDINYYSPTYYNIGESDSEFPNVNLEDYITTTFNEWSDEKPIDKTNRIIETKSVGRYRTLRPIRYLYLENINGGYLKFNMAELNVLIDNIKIPVNMICTNCSLNFNHDVNDGLYVNNAYINNGGSLKIDLGDYYEIGQIRLELYMHDTVPNTKKFDLYFNEGDTLLDRNYAYKEIAFYTVSYNNSQPEKYLIIPDATFIVNAIYNDWVYTDTIVNATYYRQMQFLCQYRYQDTKYRYYKVERSYLDGYYAKVDDISYRKDEDSGIDFYLYEYVPEESTPPNPLDEHIAGPIEWVPGNTNNPPDWHSNDDNRDREESLIVKNIDTSNISENITPTNATSVEPTLPEPDASHKGNATNNICVSLFNYWLLLMCFGVIMFLVALSFRIRHRILSHQK